MEDKPPNPYASPSSLGLSPRSYPHSRIAFWAFVCAGTTLAITVLVMLVSVLFIPDSIRQECAASDTIGMCGYSLIFVGLIATIIAFVCGDIRIKLACLPIGAINVQMVIWGWQQLNRLIFGGP
jgi:hypothetical protein